AEHASCAKTLGIGPDVSSHQPSIERDVDQGVERPDPSETERPRVKALLEGVQGSQRQEEAWWHNPPNEKHDPRNLRLPIGMEAEGDVIVHCGLVGNLHRVCSRSTTERGQGKVKRHGTSTFASASRCRMLLTREAMMVGARPPSKLPITSPCALTI